eukprot:gnl/TRDRNA2_/TRDRNA2_185041_c0_seq1.p1 gnl/TRDRNA2_/TRDRNA2_185041_c0~~gnl/TRDRNA2_/TRDRNA2_185041_c0_seq1.p1  ORF type:complete len:848 (-),score=257.85 gnl/TRDRNA2_/TRDRNA2_185041_c0_seq1:104-2380(-)
MNAFRKIGDHNGVGDAARLLVRLHLESNQFEDAEALAKFEYQEFKKAVDALGMGKMLLSQAETIVANKSAPEWGNKAQMRALELAETACELFQEVGSKKWEAQAHLKLIDVHNMKKEDREVRAQKALESANKALDLFEELGDKKGEGQALHGIAVSSFMGKSKGWQLTAEEALEVFQESGDRVLEAQTLETIAQFHVTRMSGEDALQPAMDALKIWKSMGQATHREAKAHSYLMQARMMIDDVGNALEAGKEALRRFGDSGDKRGQAEIHDQIVYVHLAIGEDMEAMEHAQAALGIYRDALRDSKMESKMLKTISMLHLQSKDIEQAVQTAEKSIGIYQELGEVEEVANSLSQLANAHITSGDYQSALEAAQELTNGFLRNGNRKAEAMALLTVCNCQAYLGNFEKCVEHAKRARDLFRGADHAHGEANALATLAEAYMNLRKFDHAYNYANRARRLYKDSDDLDGEGRMLMQSAQANIMLLGPGGKQKGGKAKWQQIAKQVNDGLRVARKVKDRYMTGHGLALLAQIYSATSQHELTLQAADDALQIFREVGDIRGEINALLLIVDAHCEQKKYDDMYEPGEDALDLSRYIKDNALAEQASSMLDIADKATGRDRRVVQVAAAAPKAVAAPPPGMMSPEEIKKMMEAQAAMDAQAAAGSTVAKAREKGAAVAVAGADRETISNKIADIAIGILGMEDRDELEGDTPFMNAGLTSASSVLFRDELASELQGINLPFTLVFDYPSLNAVTDLIMEKAGG